MNISNLLLLIAAVAFSNLSLSHSGGTDSNGCHSGSQPYHCHNDNNSSSSSSDSETDDGIGFSASMRDIAIGATISSLSYSAYKNFTQPTYLSPFGLGVGSSYIDSKFPIFVNSKVYEKDSVINLGYYKPVHYKVSFDLYYGLGVHTHSHDENNEYSEENSLNLNLGAGYHLKSVKLFVDIDTGPKSLSIGAALPL